MKLGLNGTKFQMPSLSPIEEAILNRFSSTKYHPKSDVYILMRHIGQQLLNTLEQFTERWQKLSETTTTLEVDNNLIVVSVGVNKDDDPSFALSAFVEEKYPSAIATVTLDDRGNGLCLFRLNDSMKLDLFHRLKMIQEFYSHTKMGLLPRLIMCLMNKNLQKFFRNL